MKDQLQAEIKQISEVPTRMKNWIRVFLNGRGIHCLNDIDYEVRKQYIEQLSGLRGNLLRKKYLHGFDAMKLESIKWTEKGKTASEKRLKFAEQQVFLLYHPCYRIAKTFDPDEDQEILLWDFSLQGSKTLKRQIFNILIDTVNRIKDSELRRKQILLPLKKLYLFCIDIGMKDLRKMTTVEENGFIYNIVINCPASYDSTNKIVEYCRRFLFVQYGRIYWESYVWYLERLPIQESRGGRELRNIKFSYLEFSESEHRDLIQKYMKYLLQVTEKSISNIKMIFFTIKQFLLYLEKEVLTDINSLSVRSFFKGIEEENLVASTYNAKVRAIRDFSWYLYVHGCIQEPAMRDIYYFKKSGAQIHKDQVTQDDLDIFTKHLKYFPEKIRIMCLLLIFTGIHKKSLFMLKLQDLIWKDELAWLRVKGIRSDVYREIPIPVYLYSMTVEYSIKEERHLSDIIFQDKNGKEYTSPAFRKRILDGCARINILEGMYVFKGNDYQRMTARYLFKKGMSISAIREYLGHRYDSLTKDYLNIEQEQLDKQGDEYFNNAGNSLALHINFKRIE